MEDISKKLKYYSDKSRKLPEYKNLVLEVAVNDFLKTPNKKLKRMLGQMKKNYKYEDIEEDKIKTQVGNRILQLVPELYDVGNNTKEDIVNNGKKLIKYARFYHKDTSIEKDVYDSLNKGMEKEEMIEILNKGRTFVSDLIGDIKMDEIIRTQSIRDSLERELQTKELDKKIQMEKDNQKYLNIDKDINDINLRLGASPEIYKDLNDLEDSINDLKVKQNEIEITGNNLNTEIHENSEEISNLRDEITEITSIKNGLEQDNKTKDREIDRLVTKLEITTEEMERNQMLLKTYEDKVSDLNRQIENLENGEERTELIRQLEHAKLKETNLFKLIDNERYATSQLKKDYQNAIEQKENNDKIIQNQENTINDLENQLNEKNEKIKALKQELYNYKNELSISDKALRKKTAEYQLLTEELEDSKSREELLKSENNALLEQIEKMKFDQNEEINRINAINEQIIRELSDQLIDQKRRHAEIISVYKVRENELNQEITKLTYEIGDYQTIIQENNITIQENLSNIDNLNERVSVLEQEKLNLRLEFESQIRSLENVNEKIHEELTASNELLVQANKEHKNAIIKLEDVIELKEREINEYEQKELKYKNEIEEITKRSETDLRESKEKYNVLQLKTEEESARFEQKIDKLEAEIGEQYNKLIIAEQEKDDLEKSNTTLVADIRSLEDVITNTNNEMIKINDLLKETQDDYDELNKDNVRLTTHNEELANNLNNKQQVLDDKIVEMESLSSTIEGLINLVENMESDVDRLLTQIDTKNDEIGSLSKVIGDLNTNKEANENEILSQQAVNTELNDQLNDKNSEVDNLTQTILGNEAELAEKILQIKTIDDQLEILAKTISEKEEGLESKTSEIENLNNEHEHEMRLKEREYDEKKAEMMTKHKEEKTELINRILKMEEARENVVNENQAKFDELLSGKDEIVDTLRQEIGNLNENIKTQETILVNTENEKAGLEQDKINLEYNLSEKNGEILNLKNEIFDINKRYKHLTDENDELISELDESKLLLDKKNGEVSNLQNELEELSNERSKLTLLLEGGVTNVTSLRSTIDVQVDTIKTLQIKVDELELQKQNSTREIENKNEMINTLNENLSSKNIELTKLKENYVLNQTELHDVTAKLNSAKTQSEEKIFNLREKIKKNMDDIAESKSTDESLNELIIHLKKNLSEAQERNEKLQEEKIQDVDILREQIATLENQLDGKNDELNEKNSDIEYLNIEKRDLEDKLESSNNSLRETKQNYELAAKEKVKDQNEILRLAGEMAGLEESYKTLENSFNENTDMINNLSVENDDLKRDISLKESQLEAMEKNKRSMVKLVKKYTKGMMTNDEYIKEKIKTKSDIGAYSKIFNVIINHDDELQNQLKISNQKVLQFEKEKRELIDNRVNFLREHVAQVDSTIESYNRIVNTLGDMLSSDQLKEIEESNEYQELLARDEKIKGIIDNYKMTGIISKDDKAFIQNIKETEDRPFIDNLRINELEIINSSKCDIIHDLTNKIVELQNTNSELLDEVYHNLDQMSLKEEYLTNKIVELQNTNSELLGEVYHNRDQMSLKEEYLKGIAEGDQEVINKLLRTESGDNDLLKQIVENQAKMRRSFVVDLRTEQIEINRLQNLLKVRKHYFKKVENTLNEKIGMLEDRLTVRGG
jgi:chromosome segregation ATPase